MGNDVDDILGIGILSAYIDANKLQMLAGAVMKLYENGSLKEVNGRLIENLSKYDFKTWDY